MRRLNEIIESLRRTRLSWSAATQRQKNETNSADVKPTDSNRRVNARLRELHAKGFSQAHIDKARAIAAANIQDQHFIKECEIDPKDLEVGDVLCSVNFTTRVVFNNRESDEAVDTTVVRMGKNTLDYSNPEVREIKYQEIRDSLTNKGQWVFKFNNIRPD